MKLSKKKMIPIGLFTGLTATSAIVTPLCCSCSVGPQATADHPIDPDGTDKKYNITDATYKALETQYTEKFEERLASRNLSLSTRRQEREEFKNALKSLAKKTNSKDVSFSTRCDVMIDHARENYNIQLNRQNILDFKNIEQDFAATQETYANGLRNYMNYVKMDSSKIEERIADFKTKFNSLQTQMRSPEKHGFADPLRALKETKFQAFSCMNEITAELDRIAASNKLTELFKNIRFVIKEKDAPTWDQILGKTGDWHKQHPEFAVGKDVTKYMNLVFACFHKDEEGVEHKVSLETDEWTTTLVPGYKIGVIFAKSFEIKHTNTHSIDMDFTLVRQDALTKGDEYVRNATAHTATLKNNDGSIKSNNDFINAKNDDKLYLSFNLPVTDDYAKTLVKHEYADKLSFYWCKKDDGAYENFFTKTSKQGEKVVLGSGSLANAGLMVSPKNHPELGVRLDYLVNHCDLHNNDDILSNFICFCDVSSLTKITNENGHIVSNEGYIFFKNQKSASYKINDNLGCSGFPISKKYYNTSFDVFSPIFRKLAWYDVDFTNDLIEKNEIQKLMSERSEEIITVSIMNSLMIGGSIALALGFIFQPYLIPVKIVAIALCAAAIALASACIAIDVTKNYNPVKEFYSKIKDVAQNCQGYKNIWKKAKDDYNNIYHSYDVFKNISFDTAREKLKFYQNIGSDEDYKNFINYIKTNHLTSNDFEFLKEKSPLSFYFTIIGVVVSVSVVVIAFAAAQHPTESAATESQNVATEEAAEESTISNVEVSEKAEVASTTPAETTEPVEYSTAFRGSTPEEASAKMRAYLRSQGWNIK